jgi:diguanylate cyclase (GGDEF)-like protein
MVQDVADDRRFDSGASVAAMAFPLECRGKTVGALVGVDRAPAAREPRLAAATQAALLWVLEPGAIAIDNALRVQRAEALSVTDDLTQLYNSRYLSQVLRRETKRASRSGRPLSLLFIDLDGFKAINDTHGHLYGSRALVEAAGLIRVSARETDVVARFGGDEFALILPDTGSEGAAAVGERIRERVNAHRFLQGDGLNIHLTVSVGVATLPDVAHSTEGLIQAADEAMYHVKEHGKNGIYIAGSGSEERI